MASPARFAKKIFLSGGLFLALSCSTTPAQVCSSLHSFDGTDGAFPLFTNLVQGRDGGLYGTTWGATVSDGTIFGITPLGFLSLYSFDGPHGSAPEAGLLLGKDGLLHGTTTGGGAANDGVVFSIGRQSGTPVSFSFDGANGTFPMAPLALGVDGNYYGTAAQGGAANAGTVFKVTPAGTINDLYDFQALGGFGPGPWGLTYGPDYAFYGMTSGGGRWNAGTIFRISSGSFTEIYSFDGPHGVDPTGFLVLAADGNFYGTASFGGDFGVGVVFRLDPSGNVTVLHSFKPYVEGQYPELGLVQATDGKLYGTTNGGGTAGVGTIFSITTSGTLASLCSFDGTHGSGPWGLMQHTNGKFYGTTEQGGLSTNCTGGCGTVFSLDMGLGPFVSFVLPYGRVGSGVQILGQGLTGATAVTFNGVPATTFNVASDTFMGAIVPPGATTGPVQVTTPSGVLTSNVNLQIVP